MKPTANSLIPYYTQIGLSEREEYRVYVFPGKEVVHLQDPQFLIISDNGHRVGLLNGIAHYVPYGWIDLYWKTKTGRKTHFYCQENIKEKKE